MAGPSVVVEMTGSEARLFRAQQRIIQQQVAMEAGYRKVGGASQQAGQEGEQAAKRATSGWATGPLKDFAAVLGGVTGGLSVAAAFRGVVNLAREAQAEIQGVSQELRETAEGMKYLWQVSESKRGYEELAGKYKLAMAREGIERGAAQDLVFQLKSFGEMESFEAVTQAHRFMKADIAAQYIARLRAPTAWGKEIATPEQALAGLVAGAEKSGFNVDVTAEWFARVAAQARAMGAKPAEVLGVGAAVSPSFTEGSLQATAMQRLIADLSSWRDKTIIEAEQQKDKTAELEDLRRKATYDKKAAEEVRKAEELQRKAEAIRGTQGLMATFDLYRRLEPTEYELKKAEHVRFRNIAESLEGAYDTAAQLTAEIGEQFRTGEAFRAKIAERPRELTVQQQMQLAAVQKSVAMEPMALRQTQLETLIEQAKALAAVAGRPIAVEKGWEQALQAGATLGQVELETQAAAGRVLESIEEMSPDLAKRFLGPTFRREVRGGPPIAEPYAIAAEGVERYAAPRQLLPEQTAAIAGAMTAILEREIGERPGRQQEREQRGREAEDIRRTGRAGGPLQVIHESLEKGVPLDASLAGQGEIPEYWRRRFSAGPDYWGPIPPRPAAGPGNTPNAAIETPAFSRGGDLDEAARELRGAAQDLRPAIEGLNRLTERIAARDPLLGVLPGEDR